MTWYELILAIVLLLLALMTGSKSLALPLFYITFVTLDQLELNFELSLSIATNVTLFVYILEKEINIDSDEFQKIINNNKSLFPFSDNSVIAICQSQYVYVYLNEDRVIRLRCSLKRFIAVQPYLKKIKRDVAISPNVKVIGRSRFVYKGKEITSEMILTWGNNPNKKDCP